MAEYCNVTRADLEKFVFPQGFEIITKPGVFELIYAKRVDYIYGRRRRDMPALTMILFSGINHDGNSRKVGKDAMRIEMVFRDIAVKNPQRGEWELPQPQRVGGAKRVHRVQGWRTNLQERIDSWEQILGPPCPLCGAPTEEKRPPKGKTWTPFYGCATWRSRGCQGTVRVPVPAEA